MSRIKLPISKQAFEFIRDQLAIILADEIDNQYILTYDTSLNNIKVFVETINAEDKTGLPTINVSFVKAEFSDLKVYKGTTNGVYIFYVDVYTNAKQTASDRGDKRSSFLLHKILGICRAIIDHPEYKTLAFVPGFVYSVNSKEINIRDESNNNDALNSRMGRLSIEVKAQEVTDIPDGVILLDSQTKVQMGETDEGYYYIAK